MIHISENFIIDGFNNRTILRDTIKEKVLSQSHYSPLRDVMELENNKPPKTHKVKKGETYWDLSLKYNVTVQQLRKWNGYKDEEIPVGAVLFVSDPVDMAKVRNDTLIALSQVPSLQPDQPEYLLQQRISTRDCHGHGIHFSYDDGNNLGQSLSKIGQRLSEHLQPTTGTFWTDGPSGGGWGDNQNPWTHKKGPNWDIETDKLFSWMRANTFSPAEQGNYLSKLLGKISSGLGLSGEILKNKMSRNKLDSMAQKTNLGTTGVFI